MEAKKLNRKLSRCEQVILDERLACLTISSSFPVNVNLGVLIQKKSLLLFLFSDQPYNFCIIMCFLLLHYIHVTQEHTVKQLFCYNTAIKYTSNDVLFSNTPRLSLFSYDFPEIVSVFISLNAFVL